MSIVEGNVDDEDKIKVDNVEDEEYCGAPSTQTVAMPVSG